MLDRMLLKWLSDRDCLHIIGPLEEDSRGSPQSHRLPSRNQNPPPLVTLFFDSGKHLTIGVLSHELMPQTSMVARYLASRIAEGTAYQRSPLYFELEGYVRENASQLWRMRQELIDSQTATPIDGHDGEGRDDASRRTANGSDIWCAAATSGALLSIAVGALEASDAAQQQELLAECHQQHTMLQQGDERRSRHGEQEQHHTDDLLLEKALEVCRLVRLQDDLDVLSIAFLRLTSKCCGRVAARIARHRMDSLELTLLPFVDGVSLTGFSNIVRHGHDDDAASLLPDDAQRHQEQGLRNLGHINDRGDEVNQELRHQGHVDNHGDGETDADHPTVRAADALHLVRHLEAGRIMEYQKCSTIPLLPLRDAQGRRALDFADRADRRTTPAGMYVPKPAKLPTDTSSSTASSFMWNCEEIALANLHRWWGDIAVRDYVGQKLVLYWKPGLQEREIVSSKGTDESANISASAAEVPLVALRLENGLSKGWHSIALSSADHHHKEIQHCFDDFPPSPPPFCPMMSQQAHHRQRGQHRHYAHKRLPPSSSDVSVTLQIHQSAIIPVDDVTLSYRGHAHVHSVKVEFPCLVRAMARAIVPQLRTRYLKMQESRPLLPLETEYLRLVQEATWK